MNLFCSKFCAFLNKLQIHNNFSDATDAKVSSNQSSNNSKSPYKVKGILSQSVPKKHNRNVTFPEGDKIIAGYKEAPSPWTDGWYKSVIKKL